MNGCASTLLTVALSTPQSSKFMADHNAKPTAIETATILNCFDGIYFFTFYYYYNTDN